MRSTTRIRGHESVHTAASPDHPTSPTPTTTADESPTTFASALRYHRREAGYRQRELGRLLAYSESSISRIESGQREIAADFAIACEQALNLAPGTLTSLLQGSVENTAGVERSAAPMQLPHWPSELPGLGDRVERLDTATHSGGVTCIDGPPGAGKTTLALHWSHSHSGLFPDGVLYENLQGFGPAETAPVDPVTLIGRWLRALGYSPSSIPDRDADRIHAWRTATAGRRLLIVLDNVEGTDQVAPLLPGGSECTVVVTSRIRLASLATVCRLAHVSVGPLEPADSTELLRIVIGPERADTDPSALEQIAEAAGHLPLALTLAGERCHVHPDVALSTLAHQFRERGLPMFAAVDAPSRQAVARSFDLSVQCLPDEQRALFAVLAWGPPSISTTEAAVMSGWSVPAVEVMLDQLASMHLLEPRGLTTWVMHDLLRTYGRSMDSGASRSEREEAIRRLVSYYYDAAHQFAAIQRPYTPTAPWSSWEPHSGPVVFPQFEDVQQANEWARDHIGQIHHVARLAFAADFIRPGWCILIGFWEWCAAEGMSEQWLEHANAAMTTVEAVDKHGAAWLQMGMMEVARRRGDHERAQQHFAALPADPLQVPGIDEPTAAWLAIPMGWHLLQTGHASLATEYMTWAEKILRSHGDTYGFGLSLSALGAVHRTQGDSHSALAALQDALDTLSLLESRAAPAIGKAMTLTATVYHDLNRRDEAEDMLARAVTAYEAAGDRIAAVDPLTQLGSIQHDRGRTLDAVETWKQALRWATETDHAHIEAIAQRLDDCRSGTEQTESGHIRT